MNYGTVSDYISIASVPQALSTKSSYISVIIKNGPSVNSLSPSIYWLREYRTTTTKPHSSPGTDFGRQVKVDIGVHKNSLADDWSICAHSTDLPSRNIALNHFRFSNI